MKKAKAWISGSKSCNSGGDSALSFPALETSFTLEQTRPYSFLLLRDCSNWTIMPITDEESVEILYRVIHYPRQQRGVVMLVTP
jgi:hypothetical protein